MEFPHDTNRLRYLVVIYFTCSLKVRFSKRVTARNLTVETVVRIESRSLVSDAFFWMEIIIYKVLLTFTESLLDLSQLSTLTSSLFTVAWTVLMSLSDAKTAVSSANEHNASDLRIYVCHWYTNEKVLRPTPNLAEHLM